MTVRFDPRPVSAGLFGIAATGFAALAVMTLGGAFEAAGLPSAVTLPRAGAYLLMAGGCAIMAWRAWRGWPRGAWPGYFLAGMCGWDLVTTIALQVPGLPAARPLWGAFWVLALIVASRLLQTGRRFDD